ncbi:MAG: hypothetical protein KAS70_03950 [Planctomycetes bacterium]|nr:hypothetical protein [Planctomycetota bacterium]
MGRASHIANKVLFEAKGLGIEPHFVFTESEFRRFVEFMSEEQKLICSKAARDAIAHPLAEAQLAGDIIESCESVEIF